jgi:ABC-type nickel/cobalt efflux system permease component RcnA
VRSFARILLAFVAAALVGAGGPGLRALHLATDAGHCAEHARDSHEQAPSSHHGCDHHHDHHEGEDDGHGGDVPSPGDDDRGCATCELLLALAAAVPSTPELPAFLALVAVADRHAPPGRPAPAPPADIAARPPPAC